MDTCEPNCKELICPKCGARYSGDAREELIRQYFEMKKMEKKVEKPTYCKGCSFKCQASDCDCTCHDRIREAEQTKSERCECGHDKAWHNKEQGNICKAGRGEHFNAFSPQCLCKQFKPEKPIKAVQLGHCLKRWSKSENALCGCGHDKGSHTQLSGMYSGKLGKCIDCPCKQFKPENAKRKVKR